MLLNPPKSSLDCLAMVPVGIESFSQYDPRNLGQKKKQKQKKKSIQVYQTQHQVFYSKEGIPGSGSESLGEILTSLPSRTIDSSEISECSMESSLSQSMQSSARATSNQLFETSSRKLYYYYHSPHIPH